MAPTSDMMDMIQLAAREIIRKELSLKVIRDSNDAGIYKGNTYHTVQLMLGDEAIGQPVRFELTPPLYEGEDDYELEIG